MALLDDLTKGITSPVGLAVGVGAVLLAPVLAPAVRNGLRPAGKTLLRAGITLYRDMVEPITHAFTDLVTEAQLELAAAPAGSETASAVHTEPKPSARAKVRPHPESGADAS